MCPSTNTSVGAQHSSCPIPRLRATGEQQVSTLVQQSRRRIQAMKLLTFNRPPSRQTGECRMPTPPPGLSRGRRGCTVPLVYHRLAAPAARRRRTGGEHGVWAAGSIISTRRATWSFTLPIRMLPTKTKGNSPTGYSYFETLPAAAWSTIVDEYPGSGLGWEMNNIGTGEDSDPIPSLTLNSFVGSPPCR